MREIPITKPLFGNEETTALQSVVERRWLGQGPEVAKLEQEVEKIYPGWCAVAVHSCTNALHLALKVARVAAGDNVLVPGFSFVATANVVEYCGAKPILVDIDLTTYNLDPKALQTVVSSLAKPAKALLVVHEFGRCADMEAIVAALPASALLIEDAACAWGATYFGKPAGTMGAVGCFSLHPRKVITAGEGGILITRRSSDAALCKTLRDHGLVHEGHDLDMPDLGFHMRMTDMQAAVALCQLKRATEMITSRQTIATWYRDLLKDCEELALPVDGDHDQQPNQQSFVVRLQPSWARQFDVTVTKRLKSAQDSLLDFAAKRGVMLRPAAHAIAEFSYYRKKYGWQPSAWPNSWQAAVSCVALPIFPELKEEEARLVAKVVKDGIREVLGRG